MTANINGYRLGIDMGTNSIGWAAVKIDNRGEPCGVLDMGVRIFPDGRDEQSKTSNTVERRVARGQRRRRDRYLGRRDHLMRKLIEYGLMPADSDTRKKLEQLDPYALRAAALDKPLEPHALGRALFHLDQRRGFKSNRKATGDDEKEDSRVTAEISELRRRVNESGARTLGEFLARRHKKGRPVRSRPDTQLRADRAMYEAEFEVIRAAQEPHHGLDAEQWEELRQIIFFQRPLKPVEPGWCQFEFENGERRAAKALPIFQEFRMLQEVNNLKVRVGLDHERALDEQDRERMMERLRSGKDVKLSEGRDRKPAKPTRDLGLPSGSVFNLAAGGRNSIKGDETVARLAKPGMFGRKWFDWSLNERNEIVNFLLATEDPGDVRERAVAEWGLSHEQAEAIGKVSLVSGYGNLSEKAIRKILPHLEKGRIFSDAVQDAGYQHHSDFRNTEADDELPYYGQALPRDAVGADPKKDPVSDGEPSRYGRIANPTVHIGLNQLRRVVNRLIEVYGKPEEIVVELARDLKLNREQKLESQRQQREGRERNKDFVEMLQAAETDVTPDALRKLRLWAEQGNIQSRVCPYTGKPISFEMVMSARTEVDHILPFSRTLDNSMGNMVVCLADANRAKGNRTPYEAFGHNPTGYDYDRILANTADFPANKRWRFQPNAMERFEGQRDFLDRQLNETQYLSRTARTYLAHLYDEKTDGRSRVRVIPGRMTALLRRGWNLEGMLSTADDSELPRKTRDDHRHHAIDAFVVANTTQRLLQRFAQAAGSDYRDAAERLAALVPPPWEGFDRSQVQPFLNRIVVSYKPDHGTTGVQGETTGQLHEATAYGLREATDHGRHKVVLRKKLSDFKSRDSLRAVPDPALRDALLLLWDEVGAKPTDFAARAENVGILLNGRRQRVRRVRITSEKRVIPITDDAGKAYKGYLPGGNEFADIWRVPDESWRTVVVSTFDANQTDFNILDYRPHPGAKRLMRLQIDDIGALGQGADRRIVRIRMMDNNAMRGPRIVLDDHNEANVADRIRQDRRIRRETGTRVGMKEKVYSAAQLRRLGFRRVSVDEIGRVRDRGPFKP